MNSFRFLYGLILNGYYIFTEGWKGYFMMPTIKSNIQTIASVQGYNVWQLDNAICGSCKLIKEYHILSGFQIM